MVPGVGFQLDEHHKCHLSQALCAITDRCGGLHVSGAIWQRALSCCLMHCATLHALLDVLVPIGCLQWSCTSSAHRMLAQGIKQAEGTDLLLSSNICAALHEGCKSTALLEALSACLIAFLVQTCDGLSLCGYIAAACLPLVEQALTVLLGCFSDARASCSMQGA